MSNLATFVEPKNAPFLFLKTANSDNFFEKAAKNLDF
jgi:hypothetical protein